MKIDGKTVVRVQDENKIRYDNDGRTYKSNETWAYFKGGGAQRLFKDIEEYLDPPENLGFNFRVEDEGMITVILNDDPRTQINSLTVLDNLSENKILVSVFSDAEIDKMAEAVQKALLLCLEKQWLLEDQVGPMEAAWSHVLLGRKVSVYENQLPQ